VAASYSSKLKSKTSLTVSFSHHSYKPLNKTPKTVLWRSQNHTSSDNTIVVHRLKFKQSAISFFFFLNTWITQLYRGTFLHITIKKQATACTECVPYLTGQLTYRQNAENDVQCSDKCGKACYIKQSMYT